MSLSVTYSTKITVTETLTGDFVDPADATVSFNGLDETGTLTGATTPPVTKHAEDTLAMSAGAATINLAALPGKTSEETVNGTGLKVQLVKFRAKSTNANPITITKGASNGLGLNAANGNFVVTLDADSSVEFKLDDNGPDIASDKRTWDISGTLAQELEYLVVMG